MSISVAITPTTAGPIVQDEVQRASYAWKTQKFTAVVTNDINGAGVKWDIAQGGGSIDSTGTFYPPVDPRLATTTISATSIADKTKSATATVSYRG